jgi:hypothetical protein
MHLRALFLAICIVLPLPAQAMDSDLDNIRWNGFLNVVGGIAKEDPFSPTNIDGLYSDSSNTTELSFDRETSAALQAVKPLDAETSVTLQVLSKGSVENYQARMSWLYLSHAISDTQSLRVGRLGLPLYYFSDFLNVGYAYHWISPPGLVYPFDANFTGVDYVHRGVLGAFDWSAELLYGTQDDSANTVLSGEAYDLVGVLLNGARDEWSGRVSYFTQRSRSFIKDYDANEQVEAVFNLIYDDPSIPDAAKNFLRSQQAALTPQITPYLDVYTDPAFNRLSYVEAAIRYDSQRWFFMAEATQFRNDEYQYDDPDSGLLTAGFRSGRCLWFASVSYYRMGMTDEAKADLRFSEQDPLTLPPAQFAEYLGRTVRNLPAQVISVDLVDVGLGVAIDTSANSVFKVQADYYDSRPGVRGDLLGVGYNALLRAALSVTF